VHTVHRSLTVISAGADGRVRACQRDGPSHDALLVGVRCLDADDVSPDVRHRPGGAQLPCRRLGGTLLSDAGLAPVGLPGHLPGDGSSLGLWASCAGPLTGPSRAIEGGGGGLCGCPENQPTLTPLLRPPWLCLCGGRDPRLRLVKCLTEGPGRSLVVLPARPLPLRQWPHARDQRLPACPITGAWSEDAGYGCRVPGWSRTVSLFVARKIWRRCGVSPCRCRAHPLQRREPLRGFLVLMDTTFDLLQTARH
jgi:hypothetical protein